MKIIEEFLKQEQISISLTKMWQDPKRQRLSCLCYLEDKSKLLLLLRNKEPFADFWTAPGGKIEPGEEPREAIIREMMEESGLTIINPYLKVITSETGNDSNYNWLLFIFRCQEYQGSLKECNEGILDWIPREQLADIKLPDVDRRLSPFIFDDNKRYFIRLNYNDQHRVDFLRETVIPPLTGKSK